MKHVFLSFFALIGLACTSPDQPNGDGSYQVRIPLADSAGVYHLQTVTLHSVTDINKMSGSVAVIHNGAQIQRQPEPDGHGEFILLKTTGVSPSAHFLNDGGVLHPADFETLVMTTTMYHFERLKSFYDQYNANEGLSFPRSVLMNVDETREEDSETYAGVDNASYISGLDAFVVEPYNFDLIPLALNGGVYAHEYLHSIFFQKLFEKKEKYLASGALTQSQADLISQFMDKSKPETKEDFQDFPEEEQLDTSLGALTLLRGEDVPAANDFLFISLNEAIADFFGYLYTGVPDFFRSTFPPSTDSVLKIRDMKVFKVAPFGTNALFEQAYLYRFALHPQKGKGVDPHRVGAAFSHLLYSLSQKWGNDFTANQVLNLIDKYADGYVRNRDSEYYGMDHVLPLLFLNKSPDQDICKMVQEIYLNHSSSIPGCPGLL